MFESFLTWIYDIVWSKPLVYGLLLTGIIFSLMMRFFQVRHFKEMIRLMFHGEKSPTGISSFQAIALSLAGRVGTGNIVGVSTAIFIGGPGAVFWMWATAFLGASSAFIESTLGQIYKREEKVNTVVVQRFILNQVLRENGQNIWFNICCCNGCIRWFTSTGCTIQCNS